MTGGELDSCCHPGEGSHPSLASGTGQAGRWSPPGSQYHVMTSSQAARTMDSIEPSLASDFFAYPSSSQGGQPPADPPSNHNSFNATAIASIVAWLLFHFLSTPKPGFPIVPCAYLQCGANTVWSNASRSSLSRLNDLVPSYATTHPTRHPASSKCLGYLLPLPPDGALLRRRLRRRRPRPLRPRVPRHLPLRATDLLPILRSPSLRRRRRNG
jgi:hypothetical protein